jgi:hypothetical protein
MCICLPPARASGKVIMFAPKQPKPKTRTHTAAPDAAKSTGSATDDPSVPMFPRAAAQRDAQDLVHEPGVALDEPTQKFFSSRYAHDFSSVRVHNDERAAKSADALSAHAYTVGPHVMFGRGQFAPETDQGRHLLAHELAHVVQQSRGGSAMPGTANRGLESAADHAANLVARGQRAAVAGNSGIGIACKSIFDELTEGAYAPGLILQSLKHSRPVWKIADDVNSLGAADRADAIKVIEAERAKRKARQDDLTTKRAAQTDPDLQALLDPELKENGRVIARIDSVRGTLALRRPIPGWNFTPGDFANLQRAKKVLTFASDSGWFPATLQDNLKNTLEFVLDPARSPSATEGINAVDFFHGHLVVKIDPATKASVKKAAKQGGKAEDALKAARKKEFGNVSFFGRNPITTPKAIAKYDKILAGVAPKFAAVLDDTAKLPGAAVMYHTFEFNDPSDVKARGKKRASDDPRRHYVTPLDTNAPQQYTPPSPGTYEDEFTHILKFAFQVDDQGAIHVRPFDTSTSITTLELSAITGQTYPGDVVEFEK